MPQPARGMASCTKVLSMRSAMSASRWRGSVIADGGRVFDNPARRGRAGDPEIDRMPLIRNRRRAVRWRGVIDSGAQHRQIGCPAPFAASWGMTNGTSGGPKRYRLLPSKTPYGAPEGIRTPGLCLRRAALYPAELRVPGASPSKAGRGAPVVLRLRRISGNRMPRSADRRFHGEAPRYPFRGGVSGGRGS